MFINRSPYRERHASKLQVQVTYGLLTISEAICELNYVSDHGDKAFISSTQENKSIVHFVCRR